jgi:hypothetical protein
MATVVIIIVEKYVFKNINFMHAGHPLNFGSWMAFAVPQVSNRGRHLKSSFLHNKKDGGLQGAGELGVCLVGPAALLQEGVL